MLRLISIIVLLCFFFSTTAAPVLAAVNYTHDANGNVTSDGTRCFEYNDANQLSKVKNCSNNQLIEEYVYDYSGKRGIKKEYENGVLKDTIYSPTDEYELKKYPDGRTESTTYYKLNDEIVAKKNPDGSIYYIQNDHLGSASVITDQNGQVVERTTYEPYGEVKSGGTKSKYGYTGQEKDNNTGLNYYDSRYYDPHLQRFIQPDTLLPDVYDPQQLNRYSYARNNPLRYTDPTGHCIGPLLAVCIVGIILAPMIIASINPIIAMLSQNVDSVKKDPSPKNVALNTLDVVSNFTPELKGEGTVAEVAAKVIPKVSEVKSAVESVTKTASQVFHRNDLRSTAKTVGYYLRDLTNPSIIKKVGETTLGEQRYTKEYYKKMNVFMDPQIIGTKEEMRVWEHEEIGNYLSEFGDFPALNYQAQKAVNVFR